MSLSNTGLSSRSQLMKSVHPAGLRRSYLKGSFIMAQLFILACTALFLLRFTAYAYTRRKAQTAQVAGSRRQR
jgi:heme/copper-type cytochrome/quinol oxidase subunit 3